MNAGHFDPNWSLNIQDVIAPAGTEFVGVDAYSNEVSLDTSITGISKLCATLTSRNDGIASFRVNIDKGGR